MQAEQLVFAHFGQTRRSASLPGDAGHEMDQAHDAFRQMVWIRISISAQPRTKVARLTNVEDLATRVRHHINTRSFWELGKIFGAQTLQEWFGMRKQTKLPLGHAEFKSRSKRKRNSLPNQKAPAFARFKV